MKTQDKTCILVVSDLHVGSIFGLLPPGFVASDGSRRECNPGQAYLWECWQNLSKHARSCQVSAVIVNGDVVDGRQQAQRGTELMLPMVEDQAGAAIDTLAVLKDATPGAKWYFTQGCLTPGHRVLTADLSWRDVGDVQTGDKLVGFNDGPVGVGGSRGLRETEVTGTAQVEKECVEVCLDDGTLFVCTTDHPVWCGRWVAASRLKPGTRVVRLVREWDAATGYEAGWIAGVFDGEGTLSFRPHGGRKGLLLEVAQNRGVVLDGITQSLKRHGFDYSQYVNERDKCVTVHIKGGGGEALRFLGTFRPKRLLSKLPNALCAEDGAAFSRDGTATVVSVRPIGKHVVAGISTGNGTYLSHGYGQHNTEYHDSKAGREVEVVARELKATRYEGLGTGRYCREVLNLSVHGVVLNVMHGISCSSGLYRATAPDKESLFASLVGKDGIMPNADVIIRSHAHTFTHVEHATKHVVVTPCWQLQTRYMRKNSAYRMVPSVGAVLIWIDRARMAAGADPIRVEKMLYRLPRLEATKL